MKLNEIVDQLRGELEKIEKAIAKLEKIERGKNPRRGRPTNTKKFHRPKLWGVG